MRVVFLGASRFGLRCLNSIIQIQGITITGVVTLPQSFYISYSKEKPVHNVLHADFYEICSKNNIPIICLQEKISNPKIVNTIKNWNPDLILVVGWYHIIPKIIREIPPKGTVGIHASLLPKYRGGAPLVWAIINGEKEVGVSLFYLDDGVDTGDIIAQKAISVKFNDTISSIYSRVEEVGTGILTEMLPLIAIDRAPRVPQPDLQGINLFWPQRSPEDGLINWELPTYEIYNFIRAQTKPYPGAYTFHNGHKIIIWDSKIFGWQSRKGKAGEVLEIIENELIQGILVAVNDNDCPLLLCELQFADDNIVMKGKDFANYYNIMPGDILGM